MPKVVDGDERRVELANAAIRVIARAGLGAATVREVAAEAGWTTGGLTHYFADKRELLKYTLSVSLERRHRHSGHDAEQRHTEHRVDDLARDDSELIAAGDHRRRAGRRVDHHDAKTDEKQHDAKQRAAVGGHR